MQEIGRLAVIWRYPVKSLAPEALQETRIEHDGLPGDRTSALYVETGHARTGKAYRGKEHNLLHTIDDTQRALAAAHERGVTCAVRAEPQTRYYDDDAPVSLLMSHWIDEVAQAVQMELDPLRWRPNLFVRAHPSFALPETQFVGSTVEIGDAVLRVYETIKRCVVITYDVQTGEQAPQVLRYIAQQRENVMGVYCEVERAGTVRAGDALRLRDR